MSSNFGKDRILKKLPQNLFYLFEIFGLRQFVLIQSTRVMVVGLRSTVLNFMCRKIKNFRTS